jgi:hypothetical protein
MKMFKIKNTELKKINFFNKTKNMEIDKKPN